MPRAPHDVTGWMCWWNMTSCASYPMHETFRATRKEAIKAFVAGRQINWVQARSAGAFCVRVTAREIAR